MWIPYFLEYKLGLKYKPGLEYTPRVMVYIGLLIKSALYAHH